MKQIRMTKEEDLQIDFANINQYEPIFAKRNGRLYGIVVNEPNRGWILRLGGGFGATGHHATLELCLRASNYTYHVERGDE